LAETQKQALRVFLCHASADKPDVRALYKRLVADGVETWLDQENLLPGQNWQVEIPAAVRHSDVVIVCLSRKSVNKEGYVQKEIKFALDIADEKPEGTIFIIPARLEDCEVPNRLSMYQWVDLFSKDGYERLLRALSSRAGQLGRLSPGRKGLSAFLPKPKPTEAEEIRYSSLEKEQIPVQEQAAPENELQRKGQLFSTQIPKTFFVRALIGFLVLIFVLIFGLPPLLDSFDPANTITPTTGFMIQQSMKTPTATLSEPTATATLSPTHTILPTPVPSETSTLTPVPTRTQTGTAIPSSMPSVVPSQTPTSEFLLISPEDGNYANLYSEPCDWGNYALGGGEILIRVREGALVRDLHTYSKCRITYQGLQMVYVSAYAGNKEYKGWIRGVNVTTP